MLLEGAIGDGFGAGFEFADGNFVGRHLQANRYIQHPRHKLKPGSYTDDTQMSIALAELLLSDTPWTEETVANQFVKVYKRDPRQGYSRHFYALLNEVKDGDELRAKINPVSEKTGAAMRAGVIGMLPNHQQVLEYAEIQARVTHNTPMGIAAAKASALTSWFLRNFSAKHRLPVFLNTFVPIENKNWEDSWTKPVGSLGVDAVHAAVTAIVNNNSLNKLLRACVAYTGDVDTVATIALQAASNSLEYKHDLPEGLINGLENGEYGRDFLKELDLKLKFSNLRQEN